MQLKMVSKGKSKAKIELVSETHTFADILRTTLAQDKKVKAVSYAKPHPQLGSPILSVETEGDDPLTAVKRAAKNLAESAKEMRTEFEKAAKK